MGAGGSLLVVAAFVFLFTESMKSGPPTNATFWAALIVEAVGMVVYVVHLFARSLPVLDVTGFLLFLAAFILLYKSLLTNPNYG